MIVSIDRAWVIFAEKVTFWDRDSHVAYQSHGFDSLLVRSAPNYEIDRLFETPIGNLFWPSHSNLSGLKVGKKSESDIESR